MINARMYSMNPSAIRAREKRQREIARKKQLSLAESTLSSSRNNQKRSRGGRQKKNSNNKKSAKNKNNNNNDVSYLAQVQQDVTNDSTNAQPFFVVTPMQQQEFFKYSMHPSAVSSRKRRTKETNEERERRLAVARERSRQYRQNRLLKKMLEQQQQQQNQQKQQQKKQSYIEKIEQLEKMEKELLLNNDDDDDDDPNNSNNNHIGKNNKNFIERRKLDCMRQFLFAKTVDKALLAMIERIRLKKKYISKTMFGNIKSFEQQLTNRLSQIDIKLQTYTRNMETLNERFAQYCPTQPAKRTMPLLSTTQDAYGNHKFLCDRCAFKFDKKSDLEHHYRLHSRVDGYY